MADKKITALTELSATGKAGEDFLHIIDYGGGSSPVNKKISLTNLFNNANVDTHIYGASKTLEVGFAAATNSHIKVATGANATTDGAVTINDDGVAYVDFVVKSLSSDQAIKVDAGTDKIIVNGDAANVDFTVSGDTQANLLHCDAGLDAVGIGTGTPDTAYYLDIADVSGKSIKASGTIDATGVVTATGGLISGGLVKWNQAAGTTVVGTADGTGTGVIPLTTVVSHLSAGAGGVNNDEFDLADGVQGQFKILVLTTLANSAIAKITPTSFDGTSINLNALGEGVTLFFTNSKWYAIGMTYDAEIA